MIAKPLTQRDHNILLQPGRWQIYLEFNPSWDGSCDQCGKSIPLDKPYWEWMLRPPKFVHMHVDCFIEWVDKLTVEAGAAIERGEAE